MHTDFVVRRLKMAVFGRPRMMSLEQKNALLDDWKVPPNFFRFYAADVDKIYSFICATCSPDKLVTVRAKDGLIDHLKVSKFPCLFFKQIWSTNENFDKKIRSLFVSKINPHVASMRFRLTQLGALNLNFYLNFQQSVSFCEQILI